ncbi:MAG: molybdopterin cofactor-binding domain-containing protein [Caldilinea sp.]
MRTPHNLTINGESRTITVDPERTLLSVLREDLGLTGAKYGCGDGKCGACTVHIDGKPVQACSVPVNEAAGKPITTVEGLARQGRLHALQSAFLETDALQCGYCTPGMIMSAAALLAETLSPSDDEIVHALQDNLCRCGAYPRILAAVQTAARWLRDGEIPEIAVESIADHKLSAEVEGFEDGLIVAYPDPDVTAAEFGDDAPPPEARELTQIGPLVHIAEDGAIRVYVGKAEVGQNMRAAVAQLVAEELRVAPEQITVIAADTARVPYDVGTFGSRTTPITGPQVLRAGAAMRDLLLDLAAAHWSVDPTALCIDNGVVVHGATQRTATYGDLARDRRIVRIADPEQPVTPPEDWSIAGQPMHKPNGQAFVTGRHLFAADMQLPGMRVGKVLRPPAFRATLLELDASGAASLEDVIVVHEGDFVGVLAPDEVTATRAIESIRARWQMELQLSQPELFDYLKESALERERQRDPDVPADGRVGPYFSAAGDVDGAMSTAHERHSERYTVDYIAHVPLEPRAALAQWSDGKLTVWTGTQRPFGVRDQLMAAFGLAANQVRVIAPETGAGYGGKHAGDAALEAARLAKAVGQPVKMVWTRQEEFTWAYFRPAALIELASGVDDQGRLTAWEMTNYNSGAAGIEPFYEFPNRKITFYPADSPLREGAYRALASTANNFARESHIDGWAHRLGEDPLAFRLRHITDPRLRAVLEAAAAAFGWGKRKAAENQGFGIAGGSDKGSYVAACVEVAVHPETGAVKVLYVVEAFECGAIINPDNVRAQVEGAVIQGLGGALFESVRFANGRILNPDFSGYRVPRFSDIPRIEVVLLDRKDIPSVGAGETPIIAVAPAIANAIFQATGQRLTAMPLAPGGVLAV